MGISSPSGGKRGPGGKPYLGTLWETDRVGMLLSRDRRPSRIFTRFLTAARSAIDARQRYGNERDVLLRHGCSHALAPGHVPQRDHGVGVVLPHFGSRPGGIARCGGADACVLSRLHRIQGVGVPPGQAARAREAQGDVDNTELRLRS